VHGNVAVTIQLIHVFEEPTHKFEHKLKLDRERMLNWVAYCLAFLVDKKTQQQYLVTLKLGVS
jgi:hypothetical protein